MDGRKSRRSTDRSRREEVGRAVRRIDQHMHSVRQERDREFTEAIERRADDGETPVDARDDETAIAPGF